MPRQSTIVCLEVGARGLRVAVLGLGLALGLAVPVRAGSVRADFNGDGFTDLAIGVPRDLVGGIDAGGVNVLYGSAAGLTSTGSQLWTADSPGVPGTAKAGMEFGGALAPGDFNGDGYPDLAIGARLDSIGGKLAGSVTVLYGSAAGLTAIGSQLWSQDNFGVAGSPEDGDLFGWSLAAGDFDGDGWDDLAIASPGDSVNGLLWVGVVNVLYGSNVGLAATRSQLWSEETAGVPGVAEASDYFGRSLAAADFDGDGRAELAVGIPYKTVNGLSEAGEVIVFRGSASGLTATGIQLWSQDTPGVPGAAEAQDHFGMALAAGDFDGDHRADLAIAVPWEGVNGVIEAGAVNVVYSSASGLTTAGSQLWSQHSAGVPGTPEEPDAFGMALAAGDFDGDGRSDLAIGVPYDNVNGIGSAGAVNVLYGSASGLSSTSSQLWSQDSAGVPGAPESSDYFGWSLAVGDFNGDGRADLAIGVPNEGVNGVNHAGGVNVLPGSASGLTGTASQFWSQDSAGILGAAASFESFGAVLGGW
jgi:FG-GAP repeat